MFPSKQAPVQVSLGGFHTGSYNNSCSGKKRRSRLSCKTSSMIFSALLHSALQKALLLQCSGKLKSQLYEKLWFLWDFTSNSYDSFQVIPSIASFSFSVPFVEHTVQIHPTAHRRKLRQPGYNPCFCQHLPQK